MYVVVKGEMLEYCEKMTSKNNQAELAYWSTKAICAGLLGVIEELAEIRRELERRP